jgi:metal-sulfur cluster biosynthetic enzyme
MNTTPLTETALLECLRQVIDPEIGCNIVDLGLVYSVTNESGHITVQMTLTTPGCPMHESIAWGVKNALLNLEGVEDAEVKIVWDPPWQPAMMSDEAREQLGVRA